MKLEIDKKTYCLRKARKKDALKISILIKKCLKKINWNHPKEDREELRGMISTRTKKGILEKLETKEIFLLFDKKRLVATIGLEKNVLCSLYVHPDYNRKGVGSLLVDFIEDYAKSMAKKKLVLYSTETAFQFYKRKGYDLTRRFFYKSPEGRKFLVKQMEKKVK